MPPKNKLLAFIILSFTIITLFNACDSDDVGNTLYTFTDKMLGEELVTDTTLSEFNKLISMTGLSGFVNSYGNMTCFAPDNDAMRSFYEAKGKTKLEDFTADSLKLMAYDHLINGAVIKFVNFNEGRLFNQTMSERYIAINFDGTETYVNKNSKITLKDIVVHNGVIHKIDRVLDPERSGIAETISKDSTFSLFYEALVVTGMVDSLLRTEDENYVMTKGYAEELENALITTISSERHAPYSRKYGYTVLMESNNTYKKHGIENLDDLRAYAASVYDVVYPQDAHIKEETSRENSLNRFVSYHLINKELSYTKFIKDYDTQHMWKTIDLYEYIEPMCSNTLIEVKIDRMSGEHNLFNHLPETGEAIRLVDFDKDAENGVYHEIDGILVYSKAVENELSSKRLRFDFASFFPELTNNNMRGRLSDDKALYRNALPPGYLERFKCTEQTVLCYSSANDKLMNYMGDEFFIVVKNAKLYDFDVITPPVPAGTYEVRFGYQSNGRRGVAQFYVDGYPCGVPVNLNNNGSDIDIGYEKPNPANANDPNGFENDKAMRNKGYMKGPGSFKAINPSWYSGNSARENGSNLRKILGTFIFDKAGNHVITVRGLSGGQFQIDFVEFVPTSYIEREDIY